MALKGIKHGKAVGPDGIPVEVWKSLLDLLQKFFEQEKMPEELSDSVIVPEDFRAGENSRGMA